MSAASERAHAEEAYRSLKALEAIEENPAISQRELARSMDVALGVANACVRTLVRKGLIKIRGESNRSITYHLTKEGRTHKALLAMEWTGNTINFYAQARETFTRLLTDLAGRGVRRLAIVGADEAAELVALLAPHAGVEVVVIAALGERRIADEILGHPVVPIDALPAVQVDAVLACITPDAEGLALVRRAFPDVPVTLLNGQILEESRS